MMVVETPRCNVTLRRRDDDVRAVNHSMSPDDSATRTRSLPTRVASTLADIAPASVFHPMTARLHLRAEPEMRRIIDRCDPQGRALDIGAWYGPWTYWLSKRMRAVESFEPNPKVAEALRAGVAANVTVHEMALSDEVGKAELTLHTLGTGSEGTASIVPGVEGVESMTVPTGRVDDFEFTDVRFIKIDVEGHEQAVINGALRTIAEQTPVVLVELEERMADIDRTIDCFTELGYEGRFVLDGSWTSTKDVDLTTWQRDFHRQHSPQSYIGTVMTPSGYVNNVAFAHPDGTWSPWT
jgi:FkbM family methyltransferase